MPTNPPDLSLSELKDWLKLLSESHEGIIKLINMYLSERYLSVGQSTLRSFLVNCVTMRSRTSTEALKHFNQICGRDDCCFAISTINSSSLRNHSTLVTTMNSETFTQYILGRPKKRVKSLLPAKPRLDDAAAEIAYRDEIAKITSKSDWCNANGTLGKSPPDRKPVWFSDWSYIEQELQVNPTGTNEATNVRDMLGLIDTANNTYLLAIMFSSTNLQAVTNIKVARPGFSDLGNKRFAVHLKTTPTSIYQNGWGSTVHLEKLKARPPKALNGVPERICSPIPLRVIKDSIAVKPLGWVKGTRGKEAGIDDDGAFVKRICGHRNIESIKSQILKVANKP